MEVKIKKLNEDAVIPTYATPQSSGFDFVASADVFIEPGQTSLVPTGLAFEIPYGFELQVRPRSGVSLKTGLRVANTPGTVDADFRGPVNIIIHNTGYLGYTISKGDKIAQGVICPVVQVMFAETNTLSDTQRGEGAFGSTGT